MYESNGGPLEAFLSQHDHNRWAEQLIALVPSVHEVDREAVQIWFAFFPLPLAGALARAADPEQLAKRLLLQGRYHLTDQIDSSHRFLYGHRYWSDVKRAVTERASTEPQGVSLAELGRAVATEVAPRLGVEASLLVGITAVALMTLQQVGFPAFTATAGAEPIPDSEARRSAEAVVSARHRRSRGSLWNLLRGHAREFVIAFDEFDSTSTFTLINGQELATAAANDKRDYRSLDPRCTDGEGPIPVQCRAASCGTCWVGVLSGAENLASVVERDEGRKIREFGYIASTDPKPLIRLACQAQAFGPVSVVIPPWNGVFGKFLRAERAPAGEGGGKEP